MEEKRTHQYFVGQILSSKLKALILFISTVMVVHITLLFVSYFTEPDTNMYGSNSFLAIIMTSHIMLISTYTLLCIQGLLIRDIYQVVLSTIFVSVICILEIAIRFGFTLVIHTIFSTTIASIPIFSGIIVISVILFTTELRNDIGWFYYKFYGAGYSTRHGIRMSMFSIFKLNLQVFISFWFYKYFILRKLFFLIAETIGYVILLLLFNLESRFKNNYFIRGVFLLIVLLLLAYYVASVADNDIIWSADVEAGLTEIEKDYQRTILLVKVSLLVLMSIFCILDAFSFSIYRREENSLQDGSLRKRMVISSNRRLENAVIEMD